MDDGGSGPARETAADEQDLLTRHEAGARVRAELESERALLRTLEATGEGDDVQALLAAARQRLAALEEAVRRFEGDQPTPAS